VHSLARVGELGLTPQDRFDRALGFAREEEIDLASAYSVLLGLMSLEQAHRDPGDSSEPLNAERELDYDPGFRPAVAEGRLTARQAKERGDRVAYATQLTLRHGLSMPVAFQVTDNRLSLLEAQRAEPRPEAKGGATRPAETPARRRSPSAAAPEAPARPAQTAGVARGPAFGPGAWAALVLALIAVVFLLRSARPGAEASGGGSRLQVGAAEVVTDARGRVVQVLGPSPRSVLTAYCRTGRADQRFEPIEVLPSAFDPAGSRIGLLRDPDDRDRVLAITVQADPRSRRWVAGDGRRPLEPRPAPAGAEAALAER
jgi:hypothetical protein